ncbi:MAG: serine hydrolase domain-containing protein [Pseudomonadota bacterium]
MTALSIDVGAVLDRATLDNGVPGAAIGLISGGQEETVVAGVRSLGEGRLIDADTRFHIGSAAKMLTAALVGVAVDRGLVALHDPIDRYLPKIRPDPQITLFHLLTHTGGFDGDVVFDTGGDLRQSKPM